MPVVIQCSACGQRYQLPDQWKGKSVACRCGARIQVRDPAATPTPVPAMTNSLADELDAIERTKQRKAAEQQTAENAYQPPRSDPLAAVKAGKTATTGSTRTDIRNALIATGFVFILVLAACGIGFWYVTTHPIAGVSAEERGARFGSGLGTLAGILIAVPWLVVAVRYQSRKKA